jgi:tetratricopeptide (TPR) repeat protein
LASVLREAGLISEAAEEGQAVINTLKSRALPSLDNDNARHHLRAYARAFEGIGRYQEAAEWYGKFIEFASRAPKCGGCHNEPVAPRSYAWFKDWYAGRKYAEYEARLGLAKEQIGNYEAILAKNPDHIVARLKLGYLYEATGQKPRVTLAWSNRSASANVR